MDGGWTGHALLCTRLDRMPHLQLLGFRHYLFCYQQLLARSAPREFREFQQQQESFLDKNKMYNFEIGGAVGGSG